MNPIPPREPIRVRPLWERHMLFQEPVYDPAIPLTVDDDGDHEEAPTSGD